MSMTHAPHSSHCSLICVSSICSPDISVPTSWQGSGLHRVYIGGVGEGGVVVVRSVNN